MFIFEYETDITSSLNHGTEYYEHVIWLVSVVQNKLTYFTDLPLTSPLCLVVISWWAGCSR